MTPTLISAFLTYTLITALTPGPNNILALEQRHLPWSTPQPAGAGRDERRVYYHYVDLRGFNLFAG